MGIKEEIFKATEMVVDTKLKKYKSDITIPSVITKVESNGKYVISMDGKNYTVKCAIPNLELKTGQSVWVKIPNGDFGGKHICGVR